AGLIAAGDTRLPDMTGFENDVIGSPENCWLSPYYLLADRDLRVDEVLHAWLIRQADGEPLEHVEFKADASNRLSTQWPQAQRLFIKSKVLDPVVLVEKGMESSVLFTFVPNLCFVL
nr:hypothetical protein [Tanacetum cinerariifolium]